MTLSIDTHSEEEILLQQGLEMAHEIERCPKPWVDILKIMDLIDMHYEDQPRCKAAAKARGPSKSLRRRMRDGPGINKP